MFRSAKYDLGLRDGPIRLSPPEVTIRRVRPYKSTIPSVVLAPLTLLPCFLIPDVMPISASDKPSVLVDFQDFISFFSE